MSKVVIKAAGLGKEYLIGAWERRGDTFREMLMSAAAAPFRRFGRLSGRAPAEDRIWALKNVSFEVNEGEIVGLIGRNGAGKSTLLKMLSRITTPTEGRAEIRGRVGSLLEVGTGFHPELTGRENVYLNGAILGMTRDEIRNKFDEIVDFAGIQAFLDTPVKRYSSGMAVRLAFAVAAHLETEVLLVDEVLAVGDAEFQRKCLGKMSDVAHSGRTILFVSHNMAAVEKLCSRAILLSQGRVSFAGPTPEVVSRYLDAFDASVLEFFPETPALPYRITRIRLCDEHGATLSRVTAATKLLVEVEIENERDRPDIKLALLLHDSHQNPLFASTPADAGLSHPTRPGFHRYTLSLTDPILRPLHYSITVSLYVRDASESHICWHALSFDVADVLSPLAKNEPKRMGVLVLPCQWHYRFQAAKTGTLVQ